MLKFNHLFFSSSLSSSNCFNRCAFFCCFFRLYSFCAASWSLLQPTSTTVHHPLLTTHSITAHSAHSYNNHCALLQSVRTPTIITAHSYNHCALRSLLQSSLNTLTITGHSAHSYNHHCALLQSLRTLLSPTMITEHSYNPYSLVQLSLTTPIIITAHSYNHCALCSLLQSSLRTR